MDYFYQEIERVRFNPALFMGRLSITALHDYLGGFLSAMIVFGKESSPEKLFPLPFWFFHEYVANHYGWNESTAGWRNIILREKYFNEEKSLWAFYELFDSFLDLSIQQCFSISLSKENIDYHYTNEFAPRRATTPELIYGPLYVNPVDAYVFELTQNAGYIFLVNTSSCHMLERKIYKEKNSLDMYIKQCFGSVLNMQIVDIKNFTLNMKLEEELWRSHTEN